MNTSACPVSDSTLQEWQKVVDLVVRISGAQVGLIMRVHQDEIEVFVASKTSKNPYHVGEREHLTGSGLYCENVITKQEKLLVANALKSDAWRNNPDLKYNLISYLGFPIRLSNGHPFGTICLLDNKENGYFPELIELMEKMRNLIESHLRNEEKLWHQQSELKERDIRFRLIANAAENVFFDYDLATGKYLFLSRSSCQLSTPYIDGFQNTGDLQQYMHPDDIPVREEALAAYLRGDSPIYEVEYRMKSASGNWAWILNRGQAIRDADGRPIRMVGASIDVTYLKEANEVLEHRVAERTRELAQAMSELEAFTYTVSHDIKSPLRAIAGYADLLREDNSHQLNGQSLAMLSSIQCITADMIELVNRLLEYSTTSRLTLKMESVDMSNLFVTVYNELAAQEANRQVVMRLEGDWPVVWGDRVLLRQVWTNVLANAFKFTRTRPRAEITVACQRTGDEYVFSGRDNGVGFDPHYTDKLFGIFERLHSAKEFPGHGIGLATVQKIIHKHRGRVWIAGEVDRGATVAFSLRVNSQQ